MLEIADIVGRGGTWCTLLSVDQSLCNISGIPEVLLKNLCARSKFVRLSMEIFENLHTKGSKRRDKSNINRIILLIKKILALVKSQMLLG